MIRCTNSAESAGSELYYEYISLNIPKINDDTKNKDKKDNGNIYLVEFVEQRGYYHSPEDFLKETEIEESPSLSFVLPVYSEAETAEMKAEGIKIPFVISLETFYFGDTKKSPVKLLGIEDRMSPEDWNYPSENPVDHFIDARKIMEFLLIMCSDVSMETIFTIGQGRL